MKTVAAFTLALAISAPAFAEDANLSALGFGNWAAPPGSVTNVPSAARNAPVAVPTRGTATYAGTTRGTVEFVHGTVDPSRPVISTEKDALTGNVTVTANFGSKDVSTSFNNLVAHPKDNAPFNLAGHTLFGGGPIVAETLRFDGKIDGKNFTQSLTSGLTSCFAGCSGSQSPGTGSVDGHFAGQKNVQGNWTATATSTGNMTKETMQIDARFTGRR